MWELDCKESWKKYIYKIKKERNLSAKNVMLSYLALEKSLDSPLNFKVIQSVYPKGYQSWLSIGRTDVEAETPIHGHLMPKNWLIWKDPDVGKDLGQQEVGTIEDEMDEWHHRLNEQMFG